MGSEGRWLGSREKKNLRWEGWDYKKGTSKSRPKKKKKKKVSWDNTPFRMHKLFR